MREGRARRWLVAVACAASLFAVGCRDNQQSQAFPPGSPANDGNTWDEDSAAGTGGSGPAEEPAPYLDEAGAHGSTGNDDATLDDPRTNGESR